MRQCSFDENGQHIEDNGSDNMIKQFLQALHDFGDFQFEVFCNLMLATGLRPGECTALHWDDINMDTGLLYVRYTLIRTNGTNLYGRHRKRRKANAELSCLPIFSACSVSTGNNRQTSPICTVLYSAICPGITSTPLT